MAKRILKDELEMIWNESVLLYWQFIPDVSYH